MLFGTSTFSEAAFSAIPNTVGNVNINVTGNALTLSVGASTATGQGANIIVFFSQVSADEIEYSAT